MAGFRPLSPTALDAAVVDVVAVVVEVAEFDPWLTKKSADSRSFPWNRQR